ncbi:dTDP-4-dehydrorhamnose 3,5-epimerase family protein [Haloarcula halobia]|uniref:dTDP-4-dehydrorhamnose 3,5-epimerase family protein n=1 Tax=Haloarcula halobia TaxID=3033388 RepID=UPI0023EB331B|nr:dTDP-4-dehydrorhamnose 3,5-epimerase family protein [Halomicroarcula sp. XH51]
MIHDVETKKVQINADERGFLAEIWRSDWDIYANEGSPEMSYVSESYPGIIRAWHRHCEGQIDHFVVPHGKVKVGIYDNRDESPTQGELNTFIIGNGNMELIRVPGDCWHGFKTLVTRDTLINFPTNLYDYEDPDEERLPYDTDQIPLDWEESPHK